MRLASDAHPLDQSSSWLVTISTAVAVAALLLSRAFTTGVLCDEHLFLYAIELGLPASLFEPGSSHPPLMRLIVGAFADAKSPDWLLRLPSITCSIMCVFIWSRILPRLIADPSARCLILPAMALNTVWIDKGFQCVPYAAFTLLASVHCLAWLRMLETSSAANTALFVVSAAALPWTHFYGINVLLADQIVWLLLLLKGRAALGRVVRLNLAIAGLTLPVVPIVYFYLLNDRPFPLYDVPDFWSHFLPMSSMVFSRVTFSGFFADVPLFLLLYGGAGIFVCRYLRRDGIGDGKATDGGTASGASAALTPGEAGCIAVGFLLAGFVAAQLHSIAAQRLTWPRYTLAGAWVHLPLIVFLILLLGSRMHARLFAGWAFACALVGIVCSPQQHGTDYKEVAACLKRRWQPHDAFLAQAMDLWAGPNHFDRLWFRRYVDETLPVVSGPFVLRSDMNRDGLRLGTIDPSVDRIWIYSHLFDDRWLRSKPIRGWTLAEVHDFGGPYPLALLVRRPT